MKWCSMSPDLCSAWMWSSLSVECKCLPHFIDHCFVFLLKTWTLRNKCSEAVVPFPSLFKGADISTLWIECQLECQFFSNTCPYLSSISPGLIDYWRRWSSFVRCAFQSCSLGRNSLSSPCRHKNYSLLFIYLTVPHVTTCLINVLFTFFFPFPRLIFGGFIFSGTCDALNQYLNEWLHQGVMWVLKWSPV